MKNIYRLMMTAFAATAVMTACQQENLEPEATGDATVQVKVAIGEQLRSFTDLGGVTWEAGDQIKYAGGAELVSEALKAEDISSDGYTATFTFPAALNEANRTGWFVSTKCHPSNYTEVEFTLGADNGNVVTQSVAGEMNKRYIFLHSGTGLTSVTAGETPEISMDIAGSIFRFIPYTTQYGSESVISVKLMSNTDLVGTVAYDRGGNSYRGVNSINWKKYNFVAVNLASPFSLAGVTSAEKSKGIYMAVAATEENTPLNGYRYVVDTDKATYTFDAMDKTLVVGENVVKNIMLNLDKAVRTYEGGALQYIGDLNASSSKKLSADGVTDMDGGYWYAQIKAEGAAEWVTKDGGDNTIFYSGVKFTVTDAATGAPAEWLTVRYGGNGGTHWLITAAANNSQERSAVVTATFPDVKGYVVTDECKTKTVTVTQSAAGTAKNVTIASASVGDRVFDGVAQTNVNVGYCLYGVDGVDNRDWAGDLYSRIQFKCVSEADFAAKNYSNTLDWLSCVYANNNGVMTDCVWLVSATENNTGAERVGYVVAVFPEDAGYVFPEPRAIKITQKANVQVSAAFGNVYAGTVPAAGAEVTAAVLTLTVNGVVASDVTAAMGQYGVTVTTNGGAAVTVAADGTVKVNVPENKYKNGGKEYTVAVKRDGNTIAEIKLNQAEGTEAEVAAAYTYNIVKNNGNGPGAIFGMPVGGANGADFRIENIRLDGEPVTLDAETAAAVIAQVIKNVDERPAAGYDNYQFASNQIYMKVVSFNGSTLEAGVATTADSKGYITRLTWYNSDGTEAGYWFVFVP